MPHLLLSNEAFANHHGFLDHDSKWFGGRLEKVNIVSTGAQRARFVLGPSRASVDYASPRNDTAHGELSTNVEALDTLLATADADNGGEHMRMAVLKQPIWDQT